MRSWCKKAKQYLIQTIHPYNRLFTLYNKNKMEAKHLIEKIVTSKKSVEFGPYGPDTETWRRWDVKSHFGACLAYMYSFM